MISTALSATPAPSSGGILGFDPTLILLFGLLIVVIIFMFRSSRKPGSRLFLESLSSLQISNGRLMRTHGGARLALLLAGCDSGLTL